MRKPAVLLVALFVFAAVPAAAALPPNPLTLVDPFLGTSTTPDGSDVIDDFPGADVPFGMVQWSPDTPSENAGGGYEYNDKQITGFSLTHLSGPGCSVFGDFGILPTIGAVTDPRTAKQPFAHTSEQAAPGWYAVTLGNPGIRTELTVTRRTGLGQFTYPASAQANLLFNVSSDQAGVRNAGFQVIGANEVAGFADTGGFCGMPDRYSVYFVAQFDRPFASYGTWHGKAVDAGASSVEGANTGGWVTFDTSSNPVVKVRVGLSFVDEAGALANLRAENRGWDLAAVRNDATSQWQRMLGRIAIAGGTAEEQREFYTALYHGLLHPNVYSDADGRYRGFDNRVHRVRSGHEEYANFSDWDIYRTLVPLQALIAPHESSDMMQSLVDAAQQEGVLPRWALVNGPTSVMGGDSVDPVIAGAYAFGARDFDVRGALDAMVKGASDTSLAPADGWYVERPELAEYLSRGYIVNTHTTSVSPVPNGASETLEYALDDFSIAQFAHALGDAKTYRDFMLRSSDWENLFDTASGWIAPRDVDGAFMHTPITDSGQSGFQEGNAAQYTWMVPQDLRDLIGGMGGRDAAAQKLDTFFTQINAGQNKPYAWLGNEPTLSSPWVYLTIGEPWRAQQIVRTALSTMFADTPHGIPGNDDLGTMSAWYIWCSIGLYPQNPSVRGFDVGSPLFTHVRIDSPNGPVITIDAPAAADAAPYVQSLSVNGKSTQKTWVRLPMHGALALNFDLSSQPDKTWGAAPDDAPPSYALHAPAFPPSSTATLAASQPLGVTLTPGSSAQLTFAIDDATGATAQNVNWQAAVPPGFSVTPQSGLVQTAPADPDRITADVTAKSAAPGFYDIPIDARASNGAVLQSLTAMLRVQRPGEALALGYIENRWDNSVTPFDPRTMAVGTSIAVGAEPRDAVLSADGRRLYVADRSAQAISVVDTVAQKAIAKIAVGHAPSGIAIAPDGKTLWIANSDDNTIQSIDTATLKAGKPIAVGLSPRQVAVAPGGDAIYVTNQGSNTVMRIDPRTGAIVATIPTGANPAGIAITPDGKTAYVADFGSNDVTPIDLTANRALPAIAAGVSPILVAVSPDGKVAYVTNYATTIVTPIDVATNTAGSAIEVGGAPYGVAFTPDSKTAFVVLRRDSAFVPVDVATGRAGTPIPIGSTSPYTIALP
jgi:predicted alpha-1,2-mannosidase